MLKLIRSRSQTTDIRMTINTHILIVDDDNDVRNLIDGFIKVAGYKTSMASSAQEAIKLLKTNIIDIVIIDIIMPGMSGLELTDLIKKDYDADVIVMTGYSNDYSYEEAIDKGASDFICKPIRFEELLLRLKRVLKERQLTQERARMLKELQEMAITDHLTQLYNSRHFYNQLDIEIDRSRRYDRPLSLLFLDIDFFKQYNDIFGHLEGDNVLIGLGQVIKSCLRTMDTAYRYGGEEFTIILPETSCEEAAIVADRIRTSVEAECLSPEPEKLATVTISIGITEYFSDERISLFVQRADNAMYISKQKGRNRSTVLFREA